MNVKHSDVTTSNVAGHFSDILLYGVCFCCEKEVGFLPKV